VQAGGRTWFFLTADYAFGHDARARHRGGGASGGRRGLGQVRHPLNTARLLLVPAAGAALAGQHHRLANAGGDTINSIKQAAEFGIVRAARSSPGC
jgi:branched-chain amino acid transport system substrate-binding protein